MVSCFACHVNACSNLVPNKPAAEKLRSLQHYTSNSHGAFLHIPCRRGSAALSNALCHLPSITRSCKVQTNAAQSGLNTCNCITSTETIVYVANVKAISSMFAKGKLEYKLLKKHLCSFFLRVICSCKNYVTVFSPQLVVYSPASCYSIRVSYT